MEVIADEIIIPMITNGLHERRERALVAERALFYLVKHFLQIRVQRRLAEDVVVSKLFDVFGEIAEEEDVAFANLASDFNLLFIISIRKCR